MKILVPVKRVPDPDQKVTLSADAREPDLDNHPCLVNPFDSVAVEEALRIRERGGDSVEIIAVGIGDEPFQQELRYALAMGADRAVLVRAPAVDSWNAARILAKIVERDIFLKKAYDEALARGEGEEAVKIRQQMTNERARLEDEREAEKERIRRG